MTDRMREMLATLESQLTAARDHEATMRDALDEAGGWADPMDREWIRRTYREAVDARLDSERRLEQGRRIVERADRAAGATS